MPDYSVVLFHSNNYAIWTSKLLERNRVECKVIPVPRSLSSDCGYCVRILGNDQCVVKALIEDHEIEYDRIESFPI